MLDYHSPGAYEKLKKAKFWVLDLDGTVLYTLEDLANACNEALRIKKYPERSLDEVRSFIGDGVGWLMRRSAPDNLTEDEQADLLETFRKVYTAHLMDTTRPYPGTVDFLKLLKEKQIPCALITNKGEPEAKKLMDHFFPGLFTHVLGHLPHRIHKPDPAIFHEALSLAGFKADETVYIGDSDVDMAFAKNAGVLALGANWGYRGKDFLIEHGADITADSFEDLTRFF